MVMVAGAAIFALYEVSTALSTREQREIQAAGGGLTAKIPAKVRQTRGDGQMRDEAALLHVQQQL